MGNPLEIRGITLKVKNQSVFYSLLVCFIRLIKQGKALKNRLVFYEKREC